MPLPCTIAPPPRPRPLVSAGATHAKTPGQAAGGEAVITMLADDDAVEAAVFA